MSGKMNGISTLTSDGVVVGGCDPGLVNLEHGKVAKLLSLQTPW
jgi:hypothetical protein